MRLWVVLTGLLAALISLVVLAPARLVFDGLAAHGVQAALVQGSVWNAHAVRVQIGGVSVGQVRARLAPVSVLSGTPRLKLHLEDPAMALTGDVILRSGAVSVEALSGVVEMRALPGSRDWPIASDSFVELQAVAVSLDQTGGCQSASGSGMSTVLTDLGPRYGLDLPVLDLRVQCAGDALGVQLSGEASDLRLEGMIRLQPGVPPRYRLDAYPGHSDLFAPLAAMGFEAQGDRWRLESDAV